MATGTALMKLIFDRKKKASSTKEGTIELRITYKRIQRFAVTGIRVLPRQWRDGRIVNRLDALELQNALDMYVLNARKTVNDLMERGRLDMDTIVADINHTSERQITANVPHEKRLMDYFTERAAIRKYGRSEDSQERYDRFLRWFDQWGGMLTFADITEANIMRMDEALTRQGMKDCSKWGNYHRFLNSFIIDAIDEGIMQRNPYILIRINPAATHWRSTSRRGSLQGLQPWTRPSTTCGTRVICSFFRLTPVCRMLIWPLSTRRGFGR